jgi:hypothetical protein
MAMISIFSFFFPTQRLDCKMVPRVASARKDLAVFRQAFALLHAHELCVFWEKGGASGPEALANATLANMWLHRKGEPKGRS